MFLLYLPTLFLIEDYISAYMLIEKSKYFIGFDEVRIRVIYDVIVRSKKHTKGSPPFSMRGERLTVYKTRISHGSRIHGCTEMIQITDGAFTEIRIWVNITEHGFSNISFKLDE